MTGFLGGFIMKMWRVFLGLQREKIAAENNDDPFGISQEK